MVIKSDFKSFKACPRQYALKQTGMEEAPDSYVVTRRFSQGEKVGAFALHLFEDVHMINPHQALYQRIADTTQALKDKRFIAEASFSYEGAFCAADILEQTPEGAILYEVKSKTEIKKEMIEDAAYQFTIAKNAGLKIKKVVLVYVNKTYIREGELEVFKFFKQEEITEKVRALTDSVLNSLQKMKTQSGIPDFVPVSACRDCPFHDYCFDKLPEDSMVHIYDYRSKTKRYLEGARTLQDLLEYEPKLNKLQTRQIAYHYDASLPDYIDINALQSFINRIEYPIYYLDFETLDYVIPPFVNTSPNEKLPYQASIHIEIQNDEPLVHRELLINPPEDPREKMIQFLIHHLKTKGSIFVYHETFEKKVIEVLGERFPQYQKSLERIKGRIIDLKEPFTQGMIYKHEMGNSFSIKNVYPAMVPSKKDSYNYLDTVHNGTDAMEVLESLPKLSEREKEKSREHLLAYCKLDTKSMVDIIKEIRIIL